MSVKISVIIALYNTEKHIAKCVESVIAQDYDNLELIIVNDGSTDKSGEICEKYVKKYPFITLLTKEKNEGVGEARANGISLSTGDYITYIDSDDFYEPNLFSTLADTLATNKYDILEFSIRLVGEDGSFLRNFNVGEKEYSGAKCLEHFLKDLYSTTYSYPWNKIYKRKLFSEIELPLCRGGEDYYANVMLFSRAQRVKNFPHVFYNYVQRKRSVVRSNVNPTQLETIETSESARNYIEEIRPDLCRHIEDRILVFCMMLYPRTLFSNELENKELELNKIMRMFNRYAKGHIFYSNKGIKKLVLMQTAFLLFRISPGIFSIMHRVVMRKTYY